MKRIFNILIGLAIMSFAISCGEDENIDPEGNWEMSSPSLSSPSANGSIVLDENNSDAEITFAWSAASNSANYGITYKVVLDSAGSSSFDTPILTISSSDGGKGTTATLKASELDEYLSFAGYPADASADLEWAVVAKTLDTETIDQASVSITRFASEIIPTQLFISGPATENGNDISSAISFRRLNDNGGSPSNKHEIYTELAAGETFKFYSDQSFPAHVYGGAEGSLVKSGVDLTASEAGVYFIQVDLDANSYSMTKINYMSIVGSPINGGWGGDEPLTYKGAGVWEGSIVLVGDGGYVFRANGDWGYLYKHVVGSSNSVIKENQAGDQGLSFEDMQASSAGTMIFTLDMSSDAYSYSVIPDPDALGPLNAPDNLFLLANGTSIHEFTKDGDAFNTDDYLHLESGVTYSLNSSADGTGTSYAIDVNVGVTDSPSGDKVAGTSELSEATETFEAAATQGYNLSFDFSTRTLVWAYYNIKVFHWDNDADGGWDARQELVMTYSNARTYTFTGALTTGHEIKFISPWDVEMGSDTPESLTGDLINKGGSNISPIVSDATYQVTIVLSSDYSSGTYEIVQQ